MYSLTSRSSCGKWIIDSGCTDHICNKITLFESIQDISNNKHHITTPDGTSHTINKKGNVSISKILMLKTVLYMPGFQFNLISVHKICADLAVNVVFSQETCILLDPPMRISMPLGNLAQGLYYTDFNNKIAIVKNNECQTHVGLVNTKAMLDLAKLWHLRLGHAPFSKIKVVCPYINVKSIQEAFFCTIFPTSRQNRLPVSDSSIQSNHPFDLLHIDILKKSKPA